MAYLKVFFVFIVVFLDTIRFILVFCIFIFQTFLFKQPKFLTNNTTLISLTLLFLSLNKTQTLTPHPPPFHPSLFLLHDCSNIYSIKELACPTFPALAFCMAPQNIFTIHKTLLRDHLNCWTKLERVLVLIFFLTAGYRNFQYVSFCCYTTSIYQDILIDSFSIKH